jgi:hypothetical protein
VQKHLFDDLNQEESPDDPLPPGTPVTAVLSPGESPPYDPEAT